MQNGKRVEQTKKQGGNKKWLWLLLLLLFFAIAVGVGYMLRGDGGYQGPSEVVPSKGPGIQWDANAEEGGLTVRSEEEIQAELNEKVAQGMINISMNTSPIFEDGTAKGNLLIVNSEKNNYPQVVYIVRKDTQEEIYRSGAIAVGSKVEYAPLSVDLDAGTYECVAYFNNVDMETGAFLGTAGAEIVVTVQN